VCGVFEAEQATEDGCEFRAVWRGRAEQILGSVVVLAAVQAAEAATANGVGCGDPSKNGNAGSYVEVLAVATLSEH
jgi:hypothetical protein